MKIIQKTNTINDENINFCSMTVINSVSSIKKVINFFFTNEYTISKNDSIILDFDSELYELSESSMSINQLEFNYYSFGILPHFPKSIIYKSEDKFFLSYNEPLYNNNKEIYTQNLDIFKKYCNLHHEKIITSRYNAIYHNIYTSKISFGICKLYESSHSSKLLIAYDKTLIDKNKIITIIKNIFLQDR